MALKIIKNFDSSFTLDPDKTNIIQFIKKEKFLQQVSKKTGRKAGI